MKALRRWLATNGAMEACPDWYDLIQCAKYLGVAPWELREASVFWRSAAREAMGAESYAVQQRKLTRSPS